MLQKDISYKCKDPTKKVISTDPVSLVATQLSLVSERQISGRFRDRNIWKTDGGAENPKRFQSYLLPSSSKKSVGQFQFCGL